MHNRRGFAALAVVLIVVVLLAVAGIWYYEANRVSHQPQSALINQSSTLPITSPTSTNVVNNTNATTSQVQNQSSSISFLATSAPVSISGWNTYRNEVYGYEIQYPSDAALSTPGLGAEMSTSGWDDIVTLESNPYATSSDGLSIDATVFGGSGRMGLSVNNVNDYVKTIDSAFSDQSNLINQPIVLAGQSGIFFEDGPNDQRIYLQEGNNIFDIRPEGSSGPFTLLAKQMLSTLRFYPFTSEVNPSSTTLSHTNGQYGISFQYPNFYSVSESTDTMANDGYPLDAITLMYSNYGMDFPVYVLISTPSSVTNFNNNNDCEECSLPFLPITCHDQSSGPCDEYFGPNSTEAYLSNPIGNVWTKGAIVYSPDHKVRVDIQAPLPIPALSSSTMTDQEILSLAARGSISKVNATQVNAFNEIFSTLQFSE